MSIHTKFVSFFRNIFTGCASISAVLIFFLVILVTADVFGRYALGSPIPGTYEITEALMVFIVFLAYAYTEAVGRNIRIQLIEKRITERQKVALDLLAYLLGMFIFGVICWQGWGQAWKAYGIDQRMMGMLRLPLWPSKFALVLGSFLLVLQFVIAFFSGIHKIVKKKAE